MEMAGVVVSYLIGCFATGFYLYRWKTGQDIRTVGSGNIGAKNMGRALGRWGFALTFLGDFLKGLIAMGLARWSGFEPWGLAAVMLAVVAGHNWPVQLGFKGGKGISTSAGALLVYHPILIGWMTAGFVVLWLLTRKFTLSGLIAYAASPFILWWLAPSTAQWLGVSLLALEVLLSHHANIRRELGFSKPPPADHHEMRTMC